MPLPLRILTILVIVVLSACAEVPREDVPELFWPLPPQKPRIKFVDLIIGSIDATSSRQGKFTQVLFGEEGEAQFLKPMFAVAKGEVLYVSDLTGIHIYDFGRKKFALLKPGEVRHPAGIAVSDNGDIFIGDTARKTVWVVRKKDRKVTSLVPAGIIGSPGGMAIDDARGRLLVADLGNHRVHVFSLEGKLLFSIGGRGVEPGRFNFPYDVAVGPDGRIYVMDSGNFRVQVFDGNGKLLGTFGALGTSAGRFARPKGIATDADGHVYVVDSAFGNFQIFTREGTLLLAVGSNGKEPGQFTIPMGIAINATGKIYVVDQLNRRVQVFQYITYPEERPTRQDPR